MIHDLKHLKTTLLGTNIKCCRLSNLDVSLHSHVRRVGSLVWGNPLDEFDEIETKDRY